MNRRQEIKSAIVASLSGQTIAGTRVHDSHIAILADGEDEPKRPYACVFFEEESVEVCDTEYEKRVAKLVVECVADSAVDMEMLAAQVENIIHQAVYWRDAKIELKSGTLATPDAESHSALVGWILRYDCSYLASSVADDADLAAFKTAHVKYGSDGISADVVTLRQ
jgi:hypothetical protein